MTSNEPTVVTVLRQLANEYTGPVRERDVMERVLQIRPSSAKNPYHTIREKLRWRAPDVGWVRLADGLVTPLRLVLDGLRFRVIPTEDEIDGEMLLPAQLIPFVALPMQGVRAERVDSTIQFDWLVGSGRTADAFFAEHVPSIAMAGWYRASGFVAGDSILCTIVGGSPLRVQIEREPVESFRLAAVVERDRALTDALATAVAASTETTHTPADVLLPIYAVSAWRTAYPGRPWRELVVSDERLRLVDATMIADQRYRTHVEQLYPDVLPTQLRAEQQRQLFATIGSIQAEMRESRQQAFDAGLWNGTLPRSSTARSVFDSESGEPVLIYDGAVDALQDHTPAIERRIAQGEFSDGWADDDLGLDYDDAESLLMSWPFEDAEINDLRAFMRARPELAEAAQKLMEALTPEEMMRIRSSDSQDDIQNILAERFHRILPGDPLLFSTLVPYDPQQERGMYEPLSELSFGPLAQDRDAPEIWEVPDDGPSLEDILGGEPQFDDPDGSDDETLEDLALEQSSTLIDEFRTALLAQGKSTITANARTKDLWIYAEFLAHYYSRTLADGAYATLDECLFFYYPRKVENGTPRALRDLCTSVRQFYVYLREQRGTDDSFAHAIWRRREQAARVLAIYDQLDFESQEFDRAFGYLFAPYTA